MADKRRDSKGRVLRTGELQKSDGRYEYRYNDALGVRRSVYSWRLVQTDPNPAGRKACVPLRDMEKQIQKDIDDLINHDAASMSLQDAFDRFIVDKVSLKYTTRQGYKYLFKHFVSDNIKAKSIGSITRGDIKSMYVHLMEKNGVKRSSISTLQIVIHQLFDSAVLNNVIRTNPSNKILSEIGCSNLSEKKHKPLTLEQQERLMKYCRESAKFRKYAPIMTVMMWTGCRVGEISALRWDDCDFENNIIHIRHSIARVGSDYGKSTIVISEPKTKNSKRDIPMLPVVRQALLDTKETYDFKAGESCVIGGLNNFVFITRKRAPSLEYGIRYAIRSLVKAYNDNEMKNAINERREPCLIPLFSPHALRHTFCTRLIESDSNIKVVQAVMGHANISTTMDIYSDVTMNKKKNEMLKMENISSF